MKTRLYVANLSYEATERDVREMFEEFGKVKAHTPQQPNPVIIVDRETGKSRGFGFVEMETPKDAEAALAVEGELLLGRRVTVKYAQERQRA